MELPGWRSWIICLSTRALLSLSAGGMKLVSSAAAACWWDRSPSVPRHKLEYSLLDIVCMLPMTSGGGWSMLGSSISPGQKNGKMDPNELADCHETVGFRSRDRCFGSRDQGFWSHDEGFCPSEENPECNSFFQLLWEASDVSGISPVCQV